MNCILYVNIIYAKAGIILTAWWNGLTTLQQVFACIAIPSSLIMVIQTIIALFGFDNDSDTDVDFDLGDAPTLDHPDFADGDFDAQDVPDTHHELQGLQDPGLRVFTIRGIFAFLTVFGWFGFLLLKAKLPTFLAGAIALVAGVGVMVGLAKMLQLSLRLQDNGNISLHNALGSYAQVYIPIPPAMSGTGKVTLTFQGRFSEYDAMTHNPLPLKTGATVRVVDLQHESILIVEESQPLA